MLNIREVSEKKLYHALDSINEKKSELIQKRVFNSVKDTYHLNFRGLFFCCY